MADGWLGGKNKSNCNPVHIQQFSGKMTARKRYINVLLHNISMIFGYLRSDGYVFSREDLYIGQKQEIQNIQINIHDIELWVMYGWKRYPNKPGMDVGNGTLVVGDGIVQYFQKINVKAKLKGPALPDTFLSYWHAKQLNDCGYQDFLQFKINEVRKVKFKHIGNIAYLQDENEEKLQVGFPKEPRELTDFLREL